MDNNLSNHEYGETVSATSEDLLKLPDIVQLLLEKYQQEKLDLGTQDQNKKDLELWFCRNNELHKWEPPDNHPITGLEICRGCKRQRSDSGVSNS
jgi:hypothetical protein